MTNSNCTKTPPQMMENYRKTTYIQLVSQTQNGNFLAAVHFANMCWQF